MFLPLSEKEQEILLKDGLACELYLDALALFDDLLCGFLPEREPARIRDVHTVLEILADINNRLSNRSEIAEVFHSNLSLSTKLREKALSEETSLFTVESETEAAIRSFLSDSLEQYSALSQKYPLSADFFDDQQELITTEEQGGGLFDSQQRLSRTSEDYGRHNILIICGSDIGWFNISAYNHGLLGYRTPNIDRIAREGVMFTDAYGQHNCTAGQAALITGQSPYRTGLIKRELTSAVEGLQKEDPTLAELLKPHGYVSGQFGTSHLGKLDEHLPTAHGFHEFFGNLYHLNGEEEPEHPDYPKDPLFKESFGPRGVIHSWEQGDGRQRIEDTGPLTRKRMETIDDEALSQALRFIEENTAAGTPWFAWLNTTRMHIWTHLKEELQGVTGLGVYADGMVEHDGHIGQLLDKLDELGIAENTIVVYTTHNGTQVMSWPDGGTTIFAGEKDTSWEGGYRVPLLMRAPNIIEPGLVRNGIVSLEDFVPSIMGLVGESEIKERLKEGYKVGNRTFRVHLDGYDFMPFLSEVDGGWPRHEFFYIISDGNLAAIRVDDWKVMFLEQRARGPQIRSEPFVQLRSPYVFNLRSDALERAIHASGDYQRWALKHSFILVPAQLALQRFISTFTEYPPRQMPGRFSFEQTFEAIASALYDN